MRNGFKVEVINNDFLVTHEVIVNYCILGIVELIITLYNIPKPDPKRIKNVILPHQRDLAN